MLSIARHPGCPLAVASGAQAEATRLLAEIHLMFAEQPAEDTLGFVQMMIRGMTEATLTAGGLECKPPGTETCQMAATFVMECAERRCHGAGPERGLGQRLVRRLLDRGVQGDYSCQAPV